MKAQDCAAFRTHPRMQARWKSMARPLAFRAKTVAEWRSWRRRLRAMLIDLTGYGTMRRAPLAPRITERVPCDGYTRERVEIQTEPGLWMPLYVLVPNGPGPFPAVIAPHGHGSGGKLSPAGRRDLPGIAEAIAQYNYDYGVQFVRAGCIVFCPDARGFGERRETQASAQGLSGSCAELNKMAYSLGQTVAGMWAWDLSRLVDYVETRRDCRPGRVGCAGLSGGGLQTLWVTALDERITCAIISGYFYGCKESLLDLSHCSCNYVPHLYENVDVGDIGALIAPRPLLIETGDADPLNGASGLANVKSQVRIARSAYRLVGATGNLKHVVFPGGHRWHGEVSVPWMVERLS